MTKRHKYLKKLITIIWGAMAIYIIGAVIWIKIILPLVN